jgi:hypothetical protein
MLVSAHNELLTRALSTDRNARPSAEELFNYLKNVTEPRLAEPRIEGAELVTSLVMRGANARVLWQIENAEEIQVFLGENPPQLVRHVTPADSPSGCAFTVAQPGQVTVVARNRYGTAKRVAGDVALYGPLSALEVHRPVQRPVFVSYVRDDAHRIDRICSALSAAEVSYWRDRESLLPGTRWRHEIREAIRSGNAFLAFFSSRSENRGRSFMREELRIAVEELRLRPLNRPWFIPIRLDFCEIPAIDIGGGELLSDLHYMDLFEANEQDGIARLIAAIERLGTL